MAVSVCNAPSFFSMTLQTEIISIVILAFLKQTIILSSFHFVLYEVKMMFPLKLNGEKHCNVSMHIFFLKWDFITSGHFFRNVADIFDHIITDQFPCLHLFFEGPVYKNGY